MKRTGNQKVVTAAIQNRPGKALSAPYPACTGIPNRKYHLCRYKRKWGLVACCCWYSGKQKSRPCQHSDFKSGYCRRRLSSNFRVGLIRSPFAHSKSGKPHIFPGKSGLCLSGFKFAPGKFRVLSPLVAMLCKVTFQIEPLKDEIRCLAALPCLCNV